METDVLQKAIETIGSGAAQYGWLGVLSAIFSTGIGVFKWLFPEYWGRQSRWVKLAWVFGTSGIGVGLLSVLGGVAIPSALAAGLLGGLAAIGGHQVKKSAEEIKVEKAYKKAKKEMEEIGHKKGLDLKPKIGICKPDEHQWVEDVMEGEPIVRCIKCGLIKRDGRE
jgi:hypothetical protein